MRKRSNIGWLLLLPALIIMVGLVFYPIVRTFEYSLYDFNLTKPNDIHFVGFENYIEIIQDGHFHTALQNTFVMALFILLFSFIGSLVVGLLLDQRTKLTPFLTAVAIIPWTLPPLVNGIIWDFIFYSGYGLINKILIGLGLIDNPILWGNNRWLVIFVVAVVVSWRVIPMCSIIILSHLQNIPRSYYEVAQVEGSNRLQTFFDIILPTIKPSLIFVMMQITIAALNVFDEIISLVGFSLVNQTLLIYNYMNLFSYLDFGFGSAITYVIMLISALISIFYIQSLNRREEV